MKQPIYDCWSGEIMFTAEIEADENTPLGVRVGLAARWGRSTGANLRYADLTGANLRYADLTGANLHYANLTGANLHYANLTGANLRYANLRDADLRGTDLTGANLTGANLTGANLGGAVLSDANLSGANLFYCPVRIDRIHQRVYEAASQPDALDMRSWHSGGDACGTTHCRAGWVIALSGEGGRALEWTMGTPAAAAMIYMASDPGLERIPDFYCDNDSALKDMRRLAEAEATRHD